MTKVLGIRPGELFRDTVTALSWMIVLVLLLCAGCIPYADCGDSLRVRGRLVDAESGAPVTGASLGGRTFTDGVETDIVPVFVRELDADGSFVIKFSTLVPCRGPGFPRPDQVEIIVIRDGCEQRFMIEINEATAQFVDGEFPGDEVLELTDPILVPPCEPSP